MELFKQGQYDPKSLGLEVIDLYAIQKGYLDDVAVEKIQEVQRAMEEDATTTAPELLAAIEAEKALTPAVEEQLKAFMTSFKSRLQK